MSDDSRRTGGRLDADAVRDRLEDWYQVPVLAVVILFMLWIRTGAAERFTRGGQTYLSANDPWYHFRQVMYTVRHWPQTMPFDPWTYFPYGTSVGQFGTLYDQLLATAALIVGLGDPSQQTVLTVLLYAPPVLGSLLAIPVYLVARRFTGRPGALFAAIVLAYLPGQILTRGLVGVTDHNIVEPLFQTFAVLATMIAVDVAERERPVWEQLRDREWAPLRRPLGWSAVAGVATALYIWTWPPGVMVVGIFGVFYALAIAYDFLRGDSPEHLAVVAATSMTVTALLALVPYSGAGFNPVQFSLVQPVLALAVAAGAVFLAWLARVFDGRDLAAWLYPATMIGVGAVALLAAWLVVPDLVSTIRTNLVRFVGFGAGAQTRTIREAQPMPMTFDAVFSEYGLAFFGALFGALLMVGESYWRRTYRADRALLLVWFAFLIAAAFSQNRFNYYLAIPVAVLNGYMLGTLLSFEALGGVPERFGDVTSSQVLVILLAVMLVIVPIAAGVNQGQARTSPRVDSPTWVGNSAGPGPVVVWDPLLQWMQENTPAEGDYGNANNADQLDYYGTYAARDDFDYPAGAYGVMSWWDYGHWITTRAKRIPNANPFQEGATTAANFLLAPNESAAESVLERLDEDDAKTRFVAIDYQMALPGEKFGAPVIFYDAANVSTTDFRQLYVEPGGGATFWLKKQRYYESTMVRLYRFHGSAVRPEPVVVDWQREELIPSFGEEILVGPQVGNITREFPNMSAARDYVRQDPTAQIGGVGLAPPEYVPALTHYRLVRVSSQTTPRSILFRIQRLLVQQELTNVRPFLAPSWVKLFERVPGATVQGTAPPNTTVRASVRMQIPTLNQTFTYRQRAEVGPDGQFTMTLPYSTTGYENWGPRNGRTNVSVRALGPYQFVANKFVQVDGNLTVPAATANVTEAQVIGESDRPVTVDLTAEGSNTSTAGSQSAGSREPVSPAPDGATGAGTGTDTGAAGAVAPPATLTAPVRLR